MDIRNLPIKIIELNQNLYITDYQDDGDVIFVHNKYVTDNYWNYAYINGSKFDINKIRDYFYAKNICPAVYLLQNNKLEKKLQDAGFVLSFSDAIMVFEGEFSKSDMPNDIRKVSNPNTENDFLEVYKKVYIEEGEDIYSGLSDGYLKNIEEYFKLYPKDKRLDLVAYKDNKPVGIVTALFDSQCAFLMSAAVLPEFRRMGIAKNLSNKLIHDVNKKVIFLSTEKGSVNEIIWQKAGFKTVAIGNCYTEHK